MYFQTDDRDDYFASISKSKQRKQRKSNKRTLIAPDGTVLLEAVPSHKVRKYIKDLYFQGVPKGKYKWIWKEFAESKGYKVIIL